MQTHSNNDSDALKSLSPEEAHLAFVQEKNLQEKAEWAKLAEMEQKLAEKELSERQRFKKIKNRLKQQRKATGMKETGLPLCKTDEWSDMPPVFDLVKEFPAEEFGLQLIREKRYKVHKLLRFITSEECKKEETLNNFEKLYKKEKKYYENLSELFEVEQGKFYYRDYLPGISLKKYLAKTGLSGKRSLQLYTSKDMELIVKVLNTVRELSVTHHDLNAKNILIEEKRSWGILKDLKVYIVGFRSTDGEASEMLKQVHELFRELLAPGVYTAFRQTLKL